MFNKTIQTPEPRFVRFLSSSTGFSIVWLVVRVYVGWQWLVAGWEKLGNPVWIGSQSGVALRGFLTGALQKMDGAHPDVSSWYGYLINHVALPHTALISHVVVYGEIIVGAALILGIFTGIAALFGAVMNFNYLLAGTVSINPLLLLLELFLILAWRTAGWLGADRFLLPSLRRHR